MPRPVCFMPMLAKWPGATASQRMRPCSTLPRIQSQLLKREGVREGNWWREVVRGGEGKGIFFFFFLWRDREQQAITQCTRNNIFCISTLRRPLTSQLAKMLPQRLEHAISRVQAMQQRLGVILKENSSSQLCSIPNLGDLGVNECNEWRRARQVEPGWRSWCVKMKGEDGAPEQ